MLKTTVSGIMLIILLLGMFTLAFNVQLVKASGIIYIRADGSIDPQTVRVASTQEITAGIAVNPSVYEASFSDFYDPTNTKIPYDGTLKQPICVNVSADDLCAVMYNFVWNNTLLNVTQISVTPPWSNYTIEANNVTDLGDGRSQHHLLVHADPPSPPFNGTTIICTYTFQAVHQPYFPEPDGYSLLDLQDTILEDHEGNLITHEVSDGEYHIKQEKVPIISYTPINWTLGIGHTCIVDVMIINVTSKPEYAPIIEGVDGFEFRLLYNKTCLSGVNVTLPDGHFLEPTIKPSNIFVAKKEVNNNYSATQGQVWIAATLLSPELPKNGSGILARITFNITSEGCASPLKFYTTTNYIFPVKLACRIGSGLTMKLYAVPCTIGLGEAEARLPIYIRADGSVDPPDAPISSTDNITYTFAANINDSIVVKRDNIVIDGDGYTLQGDGTGAGISLSSRSNVTITKIKIRGFNYGILLYDSSNNSIIGNNITANNNEGIFLQWSSSNSIYHNNFINNTDQVHNFSPNFANTWDDGYPSGGNYWSDHNPPDTYSGTYQNETGSDKMGDTPYVIDADNVDRYPLIYPFGYVPSPDLNNDGVVDKLDLVTIALAYGSIPGMPIWNPYADLNQDGIIDIFDLVTAANHYGETYP